MEGAEPPKSSLDFNKGAEPSRAPLHGTPTCMSSVSKFYVFLGPEEEDDEPLLSGSGEVNKVWSEEEVSGWADLLIKWKDHQTRPNQLVQLVRKVS